MRPGLHGQRGGPADGRAHHPRRGRLPGIGTRPAFDPGPVRRAEQALERRAFHQRRAAPASIERAAKPPEAAPGEGT
ncbi:hypothetical protein MTBLM5_130093 [Magnetospirillum sp. LM-5]|nr:hypothetical protein MTBLM5_130093 [Magnetospirillum sp. LM-5]